MIFQDFEETFTLKIGYWRFNLIIFKINFKHCGKYYNKDVCVCNMCIGDFMYVHDNLKGDLPLALTGNFSFENKFNNASSTR